MKIGDPHPDKPGYYFDIWPMTYGKFRLIITDGFSVYDGW